MAQYRIGTVSVVNASSIVTGVDTSWLSKVAVGDLFSILGQGVWYRVLTVSSDTSLTLTSNFVGDTATNQNYVIHTSFTPNQKIPTTEFGDLDTNSLISQALAQLDASLAALTPIESIFNGELTLTGGIQVEATDFFLTEGVAPSSASATGVKGNLIWSGNFLYICTETNVWKRLALSTW